MKRKLLLLTTLFVSIASLASAQQQLGNVSGRVVSRVGRTAVENATVTINTSPQKRVVTDNNGYFVFELIPYGMYNLNVDALDFQPTQISVKLDIPERDVNFISLVPVLRQAELDESSFAEFDNESSDSHAMPVTLSASRDVYENIANYNFSAMRFRSRGYDSGMQDVYMNGIYLNDANTGYSPWSLWTGLNDATRNQQGAGGLTITDFGPGGVNGITNIDSRAASIRKGFRSSAVTADAQYRMRLMFTYGSGRRDDGWAYAFSVSTRQFNNEKVDGVYYNAWGFYAAVEKFLGSSHRISLTGLVVPTKRGVQAAATQEAYDLVGSNFYNPNWGYQVGSKRNARVRSYVEPLVMANYEFKVTEQTRILASASFRFGENGYSTLDWYSAADPRPDYYRNMPSYFSINGNSQKALEAWDAWYNNSFGIQQINWQNLYNINRNNTEIYTDNKGNVLPLGRSKYIVAERHTDQRDLNLNLQLAQIVDESFRFNVGVNYRWNRTEYYNQVNDLLGGQYWVNVDNFAERDLGSMTITETSMNDLNRTDNLIVYEGDKFGYNYYAHIRNARLWSTYNFISGSFEVNAAAEAGVSTFWREGLYRKGLFPDGNDSFGNSQVSDFLTYRLKAYVTYKLSGAHQFTIGGALQQDAPHFSKAFVSPRTRNTLIPGLEAEKIRSVDFTYNMRMPWLVLRASVFYTTIEDRTNIISFYDDTQRTYTNYAMTGIDQRHVGLELGFKAPIYAGLSVGGALSWGNYIYTSNPTYTQTRDNSAETIVSNDLVLWSGYKVESTPQLAASLELNYRTSNNWFFGLDFNFFDQMYISMNPLYRSYSLLSQIPADQRDAITSQYRFDNAFVMNASVGKYWYIGKNMLGFNLDVKNLLNNTEIMTGGYEQMRLFRNDRAAVRYQKYDEKFYYMYGLNYYLNVYFRF